MTTDLAERRKGQALSLYLLAAGLIAVAAVTIGIETRASRPDLASGLVVPGLHDTIGTGRRIIITSSDASYRIVSASKFALRDPRTGKLRAELAHQVDPGGWAGITLWDDTGHARGEFKLWEDGRTQLLMVDAAGKEVRPQ